MTARIERRGREYAIVTGGYWAFTITDGALRMLVLLHFHDLGYSPVSIAFLFLLYEVMGIVTNLVGGWIGSRSGLHRTLTAGLALQVIALCALTLPNAAWEEVISVAYVMGFQALSGIAKDLTKMSSKSAVKLVAGDVEGAVFKLVALLTGSKNALKGFGFFLGGALLAWLGYDAALFSLAALVGLALIAVWLLLEGDLGSSTGPVKQQTLRASLSKSKQINVLSVARLFLFGARDIWFVVAVPIFFSERFGWSHGQIGAFMASWIIGYGIIQSFAPRVVRGDVATARRWVWALAGATMALAVVVQLDVALEVTVVGGLIVFGALFAVNSSLHSYLILAFTTRDDVVLDVGFYYSANAVGRLVGTMLSGTLYLAGGIEFALWGSAAFVMISALLTARLPVSS
ncbi:MAG: organoarsenical effux MFS transporter ArsJ [Actinomycetia bacterium]|nr:organoarsenical effux MFS transporter ArsJ [Actinomycetes bacterium]